MTRRLLLVHAHPDDESINTGATMAKYVAEGAAVTLVTCTLGDEGEILLADQAHRAADRDDSLGVYRFGELTRAMAALGVTDVRVLGGVGADGRARWRDSGMAGTGSNAQAGAFANAGSDAVDALVAIICEVQPQVVVTYDSRGGYGHPDHIQAHRITHAAVSAAAGAGWRVSKVYSCARVLEVEQEDRDRLAALGEQAPFRAGDDDFFWAVPQWAVTTAVDGEAWLEQKSAALRAHATQVSVAGQWYALSDGVGAALRGTEWFTCETGMPQRVDGALEVDLFSGLDV